MSKADQLKKMRGERLTPPPKAARQTVAVTPFIPVEESKPKPTPSSPKKQPKQATKKVAEADETTIHYTTHIRRDQKKNVKLYALENELKDQEVVQRALDEFFDKHNS